MSVEPVAIRPLVSEWEEEEEPGEGEKKSAERRGRDKGAEEHGSISERTLGKVLISDVTRTGPQSSGGKCFQAV